MFKEEFPPDQDWLKNFCVRVDLGFLGIEKDYVCKELLLPNKKKKKRELSAEQKTENKLLASERIYVEHAIGGMKRYRGRRHFNSGPRTRAPKHRRPYMERGLVSPYLNNGEVSVIMALRLDRHIMRGALRSGDSPLVVDPRRRDEPVPRQVLHLLDVQAGVEQ